MCFFFTLLCRKEQNVLSPVNCWNLLLAQVKRESRDHATLSDLYLNNIIPRFVQVSEDSGRLFKKVTFVFDFSIKASVVVIELETSFFYLLLNSIDNLSLLTDVPVLT